VVPVTKTWEELAKDAGGDTDVAKRMDQAELDKVPERVRASMGGPVPAGTTYADWLKEQPRERQLEILGPGRLAALERGVTLREMIDPEGRPKALPELPQGEPPKPPLEPPPTEEPTEVQKWFDERLSFVLDGIKSKYQYAFGGKEYGTEYGPEFFALGNLEQIGRQAVEDREWLWKRKEEYFRLYRDLDKKGSGAAYPLPNERGAYVWVKIGLREDIVQDHMVGMVSNANDKWDWDGYCRYDPPLPPAQKTDMLLCHEIGHTLLSPYYKGKDGRGHGAWHEKKTLELMKMLYPGFPGKHRRI